jgi:hypothetical protein
MSKCTLLYCGALGVVVAIVAGASAAARSSESGSASSDLRMAEAATAKYHSVTQATKDGYVREGVCVASPAGAMGIHYVDPRLASDTVLDPEHPEMLLYQPDARGKLRLVGVEYFIAAADQEPPIDDSDRPRLFDRPLDGPMEGHGPSMPFHYDLHVWLWANNPAGTFAPVNPSLTCPP